MNTLPRKDGGLRILVVHGPNLNLLGRREPEIYGTATLEQINLRLRRHARAMGVRLDIFQSNHEGAIVERIQRALLDEPMADGIVINPAGYTHTSVAIRDAITAVSLPTWEIHLTEPKNREPFRHVSYVTDVCVGRTAGKGVDGYLEALDGLVARLRDGGKETS